MKPIAKTVRKLTRRAEDLIARGQFRSALKPAREAHLLAQDHLPADHDDALAAAQALGMVLVKLGDREEGLRLLQLDDVGHEDPEHAINALNADLLQAVRDGPAARAETKARVLLERARRELAADSLVLSTTVGLLAQLLESKGEMDEAEALYRESLAIRRPTQQYAPIAMALNDLADLLNKRDRHSEAILLFEEAVALKRKSLGDRHPSLATTLSNFASALHAAGDSTRAEALLRESLDIAREALGNDHPEVALKLHNLGVQLTSAGRADEAEPVLRQSVELLRRALGDVHPTTVEATQSLAALYLSSHRFADAESTYARLADSLRATYGGNHAAVATARKNAARARDFLEGRATPPDAL